MTVKVMEMVYHPGRVLKVFPSEGRQGETAATIRFWDNNLHTVKVSREISAKLREKSTVLVDYYPVSERMNRPRMIAVKIVNKEDEKELWSHYQDFLKLKKKAMIAKKMEGAQPPARSMVGVG
jgi:hypothetical protein